MARESIADLVAKLHNGKVDRREFFTRAVAAGLSIGLARQALLAAGVSAQELPEAARIGNPDVAHTTDSSKGMIKLYSSWPLTGSYDRIGGDAVEAVKLALEDFGNAAGGFAIEYEALDDGASQGVHFGGVDAASFAVPDRGAATRRDPDPTGDRRDDGLERRSAFEGPDEPFEVGACLNHFRTHG